MPTIPPATPYVGSAASLPTRRAAADARAIARLRGELSDALESLGLAWQDAARDIRIASVSDLDALLPLVRGMLRARRNATLTPAAEVPYTTALRLCGELFGAL